MTRANGAQNATTVPETIMSFTEIKNKNRVWTEHSEESLNNFRTNVLFRHAIKRTIANHS